MQKYGISNFTMVYKLLIIKPQLQIIHYLSINVSFTLEPYCQDYAVYLRTSECLE